MAKLKKSFDAKAMKPEVTSEDGILTKLFRKIIFDTGLVNRLDRNINKYVKSGGKKNKATITSIIIDSEMTWKSLMFLIFEILRVKKLKIRFTLEHESGLITEHEIDVSPKKQTVKDDIEEEEDTGRVKGNKKTNNDSNKQSK